METSSVAEELGVTEEAVELFRSSDAIDLHIESFVWRRIFGYDLHRPHRGGVFGRFFFGHADFPTARKVGLGGATWVISTNPARSARGRRRAFEKNLGALRTLLREAPGVRHVRTAAELRAARAAGDHAAFIGIQDVRMVQAERTGSGVEASKRAALDMIDTWLPNATVTTTASVRTEGISA